MPCGSLLGSHFYVFHQEWCLPTLHTHSRGMSQCLWECLCPCLNLTRILAPTVAGHIVGVKTFWCTLQVVTAEDGLEKGEQRQIKDSGWEGAASQKAIQSLAPRSLCAAWWL